ncbi:MAG: FGGY family carbohydrate kinase [Anaerolineales bacterium]|jgi:xylulokinase
MHLIGLDIGTTGCKAVLFDQNGTLLAKASQEYTVDFPHPNWAEQNIETVWTLAQVALREAIIQSGKIDIAALSLSVHGEAVTPVDENGHAIRASILGMDTRTDEQNIWLCQHLGAEHLFDITGMPVHTINTLPKLLWLKQYEPDMWKRATRFLLVEDFFIQKMTGQAVISQCLASRTQLYDLCRGDWSDEILVAIELDRSRLSVVKPSGTAVMPMDPELATSLGLAHPPLIVSGGHDQACGALGVGLTRPGLAMVSTGTAEVVEVALPSPTLNHFLFGGNISVYHHVVPGLYLAMTLNQSGGMCLRWFRDNLCEMDVSRANETSLDAYDFLLRNASSNPTNLLVLPHFSGSGTPTFDTASKAAILGLTFSTTRTDLAKAILEGLTYELRVNLDLLKAGGVQIDELRAIGGGAKSALWLQLKADITGIPVAVPEITEAAGLGAAILAGMGAGVFNSPSEVVGQILHFRKIYRPNPKFQQEYDQRFGLYRKVYPAVSPITHEL